jgi:hypothetical protein
VGEGKFGNKEQLMPFIQACKENGIAFTVKHYVPSDEHKKIIGSSFMAPAIVGKWQEEQGYIPCRIFKNISYGKMGVTNSRHVFELFEQKIVYNPDTYQLFYDAKTKLETMRLDELYELMDFVKLKHTYLNRIATLLDFLNLVQEAFSNA